MRALTAIVLAALTALPMLEAPPASAADLSLERTRRVAVRHVHHRSVIVRDCDGTPVFFRRRAVLVRTPDGVLRTELQSEAIPVLAAQPRRWLSGAPVQPNYPRGRPRGLRYAWG